ncbi:unnamed protein product [Caenorhabditis angaria]|uniref:Uncharacterized protein n=1 Tax=Caenorhabditis angaria TaxID=860376 RepID=A0A9P1IZP8_9PELO|nr:unnamed protein product [Caenorhabditis angaria]
MNVLIIVAIYAWIENFIGKFITVPYTIGYWKINDSSFSTINNDIRLDLWWTDKSSDIPKISDYQSILPLIIGGVFQWHYIYIIISSLCAIIAERTFASIFLNNYENQPRSSHSTGATISKKPNENSQNNKKVPTPWPGDFKRKKIYTPLRCWNVPKTD